MPGPRVEGHSSTYTSPGMRRRHFTLPDDLSDRMRQAAKRLKVSEATIVRRGIHNLLKEVEQAQGEVA